jgi:hypothetical protein
MELWSHYQEISFFVVLAEIPNYYRVYSLDPGWKEENEDLILNKDQLFDFINDNVCELFEDHGLIEFLGWT